MVGARRTRFVGTMFISRVRGFGRILFAAAKPETSAARAASSVAAHNPLEEFFEADRSKEDDKPVVYGRSWKAAELRLKSWDDLQKLWFVLMKEKNMLMTQRQMLHAQNLRFPNPERIPKVRKSMCRIKHVLTERAIAEPDPRRSAEMKRMINAL
ncbi:39S ribosomal protein L47 [Nymphaea thermarum]|nr:39S ribosomal protein L47 [Nymphaea thermarum]